MGRTRPDEELAVIVGRAAGGDLDAWSLLVGRFEDAAVAMAVAAGCWDDAADVAQEAFALAFRHLGSLRDPQAFPAWFATLVRTAAGRRHRRARFVEVPLDGIDPLPDEGGADPAAALEAATDADQVRALVEVLPVEERAVVALHHLGGLPYRDVASFLAITESTAKKRASRARTRMKELFPMVTEAFEAARPSRDGAFRDTLLLFIAIRRRDHATVRRLLAADPGLVHVTEEWSVDEAMATQLGFAGKASPLIRAAQTGDVALVGLLLDAGAAVNAPCDCQGAESALWAAALFGNEDVVAQLLAAGADVDLAAFAGATPLHAAAQRGHDRIEVLLLAAGADPERTDDLGRRPADWRDIVRARSLDRREGWLATGIRAVDLFAPVPLGGIVRFPPAYGLGQAVAIFQIADHLAPAELWIIGFSHGGYEPATIEHESRETGVPVTVRLSLVGEDPGDRRAAFADAVDEVAHRSDADKLVVCQEAPGFTHDVLLALPTLQAAASVLATLVVDPAPAVSGELAIDTEPPEGYDAQVAFSPARARARLWPAVDPATTTAWRWPDERHHELAVAATTLLADYERADPTFALPDPATLPDPDRAAKGQALVRYLVQSFRIAEAVTSEPGERTPVHETLDRVEAILA
jgi:RNA polymerase sigma factor (sigma-70 family)